MGLCTSLTGELTDLPSQLVSGAWISPLGRWTEHSMPNTRMGIHALFAGMILDHTHVVAADDFAAQGYNSVGLKLRKLGVNGAS